MDLQYNEEKYFQVWTLTGHEDHVWSVDMNKEYIVSGSWDSRLIQFDILSWSSRISLLVFAFGIDARERSFFFTHIHMEGKKHFC